MTSCKKYINNSHFLPLVNPTQGPGPVVLLSLSLDAALVSRVQWSLVSSIRKYHFSVLSPYTLVYTQPSALCCCPVLRMQNSSVFTFQSVSSLWF